MPNRSLLRSFHDQPLAPGARAAGVVISAVVAQDGRGVTYRGWDTTRAEEVFLVEHLPRRSETWWQRPWWRPRRQRVPARSGARTVVAGGTLYRVLPGDGSAPVPAEALPAAPDVSRRIAARRLGIYAATVGIVAGALSLVAGAAWAGHDLFQRYHVAGETALIERIARGYHDLGVRLGCSYRSEIDLCGYPDVSGDLVDLGVIPETLVDDRTGRPQNRWGGRLKITGTSSSFWVALDNVPAYPCRLLAAWVPQDRVFQGVSGSNRLGTGPSLPWRSPPADAGETAAFCQHPRENTLYWLVQ